MEVVSEHSIMEETAAAQLQDGLPYRSRFASHCTIIYSPSNFLYLDEKSTLNKRTSGIVFRKERSQPPTKLVNDNSKVRLLTNHT